MEKSGRSNPFTIDSRKICFPKKASTSFPTTMLSGAVLSFVLSFPLDRKGPKGQGRHHRTSPQSGRFPAMSAMAIRSCKEKIRARKKHILNNSLQCLHLKPANIITFQLNIVYHSQKISPQAFQSIGRLSSLAVPSLRICGKICIFARQQPSNRQGVASLMHRHRQEYYSTVIRLLFVCYSI